jgi:hypothetical protein
MDMGALPELPRLRFLYTILIPTETSRILVQRYGHTLESIVMNIFGDPTSDYLSGWGDMPRLRYLCVTMRGGLRVEERLQTGAWPSLREFYGIHLAIRPGCIPTIFHNINSFGPNLRKMMLFFRSLCGRTMKLEDGAIRGLSLDRLQLLESLTLYVCGLNLGGIDFILPLGSLRQLYLRYVRKRVRDGMAVATTPRSETIQFRGYTNTLYDSNIWSLLPALELVDISVSYRQAGDVDPWQLFDMTKAKHKVYTRRGYEQYQYMK